MELSSIGHFSFCYFFATFLLPLAKLLFLIFILVFVSGVACQNKVRGL